MAPPAAKVTTIPPFRPVHMHHISVMARSGLKLAPWAVAGGLAAGWLVWPALTDNFKVTIGVMKAPEEE